MLQCKIVIYRTDINFSLSFPDSSFTFLLFYFLFCLKTWKSLNHLIIKDTFFIYSLMSLLLIFHLKYKILLDSKVLWNIYKLCLLWFFLSIFTANNIEAPSLETEAIAIILILVTYSCSMFKSRKKLSLP